MKTHAVMSVDKKQILAKNQSPQDELELELIQPHMAQKPVLRGEVGCACVAREVSVERESEHLNTAPLPTAAGVLGRCVEK